MNKIRDSLKHELSELVKARAVMAYSYDKCSKSGVRPDLSHMELESFEALTSRFARLSDILIQKIFRYFDSLDLEDHGTVRDRINRAEKKEIIASADEFIQIRVLRNEISHEYKSDTIYSIFEKVLAMTPVLLSTVDRVMAYSSRYEK
jgi:hypothetical protein